MKLAFQLPILLTATVVLTLPAASLALAGGKIEEPSYESASNNWPPLMGQTVVLAAKNSRAKFVSTFGGGLHTVYAPSLPTQADLKPHMFESLQVVAGTGITPDFRLQPRHDIRQRLHRGSLPLVITTWMDPDGELAWEQASFVRLMGDRLEVTRGDENAAALTRLRVFNPTATERTAHVSLSLSQSPNNQPRSVSTPVYKAPLILRDGRIETEPGSTRLMWSAPAGAAVEANLSGLAFKYAAYGDHADNPLPKHEVQMAFDGSHATFWRPSGGNLEGTSGIGWELSQPVWIRQAVFQYWSNHVHGEHYPAMDGQDLQYFDGEAWISIDDEITTSIGYGKTWTHNFAPVRAQGLRIMISGMPPDEEKKLDTDFGYPAIMIADLTYNNSEAPPTESTVWTSTASPSPLENHVHFKIAVPARSSRDLVYKIPFLAAPADEAERLAGMDFDRQFDMVSAYWQGSILEGASFRLPERVVQEVWDANIPKIFVTTDIDPANGLAITKTNVGFYEAIWANLSAAVAIALDLRGYHEDAALYLEPFLQWQGTVNPPGADWLDESDFESKEGFLTAGAGYSRINWVSNNGWLLWALCEHYRLSGDRSWLDRALPNILASCDWVQRARRQTMVDGADGTRPPEWGLLPRGAWCDDPGKGFYYCFSDAYNWLGVASAAEILKEIGHPRAGEIAALAEEYGHSIGRAVRWATEQAAPYRLRSGQVIPFVPTDVYNSLNIGNQNKHVFYLDVGPIHLVEVGLIDARSDLASWMIAIAEDHWQIHGVAKGEPFYAPQRSIYLGRDEIDKFLMVYYNLLAEGMDRQTYTPVEMHNTVQNLPWCDAEHTRFVRAMLIEEREDSLRLAPAIPRRWLNYGQVIEARRAPTWFGEISFTIESQVLADDARTSTDAKAVFVIGGRPTNRITARVTPPERKPVPIALRLRHPQGQPIKEVLVDGAAHEDFGDEWINLPARTEAMTIEASY